jgi:hypothetical protein
MGDGGNTGILQPPEITPAGNQQQVLSHYNPSGCLITTTLLLISWNKSNSKSV